MTHALRSVDPTPRADYPTPSRRTVGIVAGIENPDAPAEAVARQVIDAVDARAWCAAVISATFPGPSPEAVANRACLPLRSEPDTIARILRGHVERFDGRILARALVWAEVYGVDARALMRRARR